MKHKVISTTMLSGLAAVSKTDANLDYVQFLPDNEVACKVEPFRGRGHAQLLSDGSFDFLRTPQVRRKPILKLPHSSLSYGEDGYDRFTVTVPSTQRDEFAQILMAEAPVAAAFVKSQTTNT